MKELLLVLAVLAMIVAAPQDAAHADSGRAVWPLDPVPVVVEHFDPPTTPWGAGHRGVDLLGRPGQEVHAALAGTISYAGTLAGRGVVVVDHGTTRTTYEPVDPAVRVGDRVSTGAVLGVLQTGLSHCFPRTCLHWGLISSGLLEGDRYLDPLSLLGAAPVRLLPLALPWVVMPWGAPAGRPFAASPR